MGLKRSTLCGRNHEKIHLGCLHCGNNLEVWALLGIISFLMTLRSRICLHDQSPSDPGHLTSPEFIK